MSIRNLIDCPVSRLKESLLRLYPGHYVEIYILGAGKNTNVHHVGIYRTTLFDNDMLIFSKYGGGCEMAVSIPKFPYVNGKLDDIIEQYVNYVEPDGFICVEEEEEYV